MGLGVRFLRGLTLCCVVLGGTLVGTGLVGVASSGVAAAQSANSIDVRGNRRVETSTVQSYFKPGPGGRLSVEQEDEGLKSLIATGLFEDVRIDHSGGRLVVTVVENPVINRVAFEGNKKAKDDQLKVEVQSKPRGTLSRPTVQADVQRIIEIYHRSGRFDVRVEPKIIELPNNRGDRNFEAKTINLVFVVEEGTRAYIERINVIGNVRTRDYVIRREFDISEGDAYNRALVDRAERRLKNLDYFKTVKISTEPGSSSDRVILVVDLEEKSTGDFSVSGGYSTTDGALAEVSVSERNFLGRGLFAKATVTYGQYARGYSLSFVEPYLLDYRVALGLDLYQRSQLANSYISYGTSTLGFSPRLGFAPVSYT